MDTRNTTSLCLTALDHTRLLLLTSALVALGLGGCGSSHSRSASVELVKPPRSEINTVELAAHPFLTAREAPSVEAAVHNVEPYVPHESIVATAIGYKPQRAKKACGVRDRFDRKEMVAYEWGRNRMGLDVDGLSVTGGSVDNVQFSYRLRLQDYKTKKERCRYASSWQGLIGSGYNELVLRDTDTVWQELEIMEDQYAPW